MCGIRVKRFKQERVFEDSWWKLWITWIWNTQKYTKLGFILRFIIHFFMPSAIQMTQVLKQATDANVDEWIDELNE